MVVTRACSARRASRLALAAWVVGAVGLSGCSGESDASPLERSGSVTPSVSLLSVPEWSPEDEGEHVPLEPGTYDVPSSPWSVAGFTVTFPEGWTVQYGHVFALHGDTADELGFYPVVVDEVFADACRGEGGSTRAIGPGVDSLITALRDQDSGLETEVSETTLGGYPATRIDLRISRRTDLDRCQMAEYGFTGLQVWYSEPADKYFVLLPGAVATAYVLDVDGERQVFLTQVGNPDSKADLVALERVLDSIDIEK
jgi:hypothetical protein